MYRRRPRIKKKRKKPSFSPYRSGLEKRLATGPLVQFDYEPKSAVVEYSVPHKYNPDFVHKDCPNVILEVKGYFKTSTEASKYVSVARDNPDKELIFILSDPYKKAYPTCAERKDGSYQTLAEWCKRHKFLYYKADDIPKEIKLGRMTEHWIRNEKLKRGY